MLFRSASTVVLLAALAGGPAFAQDQQQQQTQTQNQQNNEQQNQQQAEATTAGSGECFEQLTAFSQRLRDEQFWVTGWGTPYTTPTATAADRTAATPWSGVTGIEPLQSPRTQIRELYGAAQVLAYRGEAEGCEYLIGVLNNTYEEYVSTLTEAGVEPEEITSWRSEQIALSQPVTEMQVGRVNVDELTGTDVRNTNDQNLGTVSDIVIDPQSGQIAYAIVARGGFLGVGEEHVAVPWQRFRATPGLNTLVLDVSEEELAQAPTIDPAVFSDPARIEQQNQEIEDYWG